MELEFTTTACVRPEVLDITYYTLNNILADVDTKTEGKLYINIDPVPTADSVLIDEMLCVANEHFSQVVHNIGQPGGSFPRAVSWCFSQPTGKYFFHIEDDWQFYRGRIYIDDYIEQMDNDKRGDIGQCIIGNNPGLVTLTPESQRIYLAPSLCQTAVIQSKLKKFPIPDDWDPEYWFMHKFKTDQFLVLGYNGISERSKIPVGKQDIGHAYMKNKGMWRHSARKDGWGDWRPKTAHDYHHKTFSRHAPPSDMVTTHNNHGFFSCCGVALIHIIDYVNNQPLDKTHYPVVDFSKCFEFYKNDNMKPKYQGIYTDLFKDNISEGITMGRHGKPDRHIITNSHPQYDECKKHKLLMEGGVKKLYPPIGLCQNYISIYDKQKYNQLHWEPRANIIGSYDEIKKYVELYFTPSVDVQIIEHQMKTKYKIDVEKTLCVYYRGTDKATEIIPTPFSDFARVAEDIVSMDSDIDQVLVQTDQEQFIEYIKPILESKNKRVVVIEENPTTSKDSLGVFRLIDGEDKLAKAQTFLATTHLMSQCKYVVTSTTNVAAFINLYRGKPDGFIQMCNGSHPSGGAALPVPTTDQVYQYKY